MKKQLKFTFITLILFSLSLAFGISVTVNQYRDKKMIRSRIKEITVEVEKYYTKMNYDESVIEFFSSSNYRVTILTANFQLKADSLNHDQTSFEQEEEFKRIGHFINRKDKFLDADYLYYVVELSNGDYLRVGYNLDLYFIDQNNHILVILIVIFILSIISYMFASKWIKHIFEPMNVLVNDIDYLKVNHSFFKIPLSNRTELDELIRRINYMNADIEENMNDLSRQKELLDILLNHSNQGILIFSSDQEIVLQNQMYDLKELNEVISANLSRAVNAIIVETYQVEISNQFFQIRMASVTNKNLIVNKGKNGVLVLIEDVTNKMLLEKNKRDFFANASHELRSPITSIRGEAELILYDMVPNEEKYELASKIIKQTGLMDELLTDMLLLSRLENRPKEIKEQLLLDQILIETIDDLKTRLEEKEITLTSNISHVIYFGNISDFRSLFKNLIENAIKYNKPKGQINISLVQKRQTIEFIIKDTGIGISKEHQQRIFERFYQVNKNRNQGIQGTGLGLAIVKHIVNQYHGVIDVDSRINVGTKFTVKFDVY